jgi:hypothetical protein
MTPEGEDMDYAPDGDQLRALLAPLDRLEPALRGDRQRRRNRRGRLTLCAAAGVALLALAGAAIGSGIDPFAGISAADHPATPEDVVPPDVVTQLRTDEPPAGAVDSIGLHRVDSSRLVGTLPSGRKIYVMTTAKNRLCVVVAGQAESCGDQLTRESPITFTILSSDLEAPLAYGVARDDVASVSFTVRGRTVTLPVRNNFFVYEGQRSDGVGGFSGLTVTFDNGMTEVPQ